MSPNSNTAQANGINIRGAANVAVSDQTHDGVTFKGTVSDHKTSDLNVAIIKGAAGKVRSRTRILIGIHAMSPLQLYDDSKVKGRTNDSSCMVTGAQASCSLGGWHDVSNTTEKT